MTDDDSDDADSMLQDDALLDLHGFVDSLDGERSVLPLIESDNRCKCRHERYTAQFDLKGRKVWCGSCEVELDPFDVLSWFTRNGDRKKGLRRELKNLTAELEQLKKSRKRIMARVSRAKRQLLKETESITNDELISWLTKWCKQHLSQDRWAYPERMASLKKPEKIAHASQLSVLQWLLYCLNRGDHLDRDV